MNNNIIEDYKNFNWLFKYNMNRLEKAIEKIKTNILHAF